MNGVMVDAVVIQLGPNQWRWMLLLPGRRGDVVIGGGKSLAAALENMRRWVLRN